MNLLTVSHMSIFIYKPSTNLYVGFTKTFKEGLYYNTPTISDKNQASDFSIHESALNKVKISPNAFPNQSLANDEGVLMSNTTGNFAEQEFELVENEELAGQNIVSIRSGDFCLEDAGIGSKMIFRKCNGSAGQLYGITTKERLESPAFLYDGLTRRVVMETSNGLKRIQTMRISKTGTDKFLSIVDGKVILQTAEFAEKFILKNILGDNSKSIIQIGGPSAADGTSPDIVLEASAIEPSVFSVGELTNKSSQRFSVEKIGNSFRITNMNRCATYNADQNMVFFLECKGIAENVADQLFDFEKEVDSVQLKHQPRKFYIGNPGTNQFLGSPGGYPTWTTAERADQFIFNDVQNGRKIIDVFNKELVLSLNSRDSILELEKPSMNDYQEFMVDIIKANSAEEVKLSEYFERKNKTAKSGSKEKPYDPNGLFRVMSGGKCIQYDETIKKFVLSGCEDNKLFEFRDSLVPLIRKNDVPGSFIKNPQLDQFLTISENNLVWGSPESAIQFELPQEKHHRNTSNISSNIPPGAVVNSHSIFVPGTEKVLEYNKDLAVIQVADPTGGENQKFNIENVDDVFRIRMNGRCVTYDKVLSKFILSYCVSNLSDYDSNAANFSNQIFVSTSNSAYKKPITIKTKERLDMEQRSMPRKDRKFVLPSENPASIRNKMLLDDMFDGVKGTPKSGVVYNQPEFDNMRDYCLSYNDPSNKRSMSFAEKLEFDQGFDQVLKGNGLTDLPSSRWPDFNN